MAENIIAHWDQWDEGHWETTHHPSLHDLGKKLRATISVEFPTVLIRWQARDVVVGWHETANIPVIVRHDLDDDDEILFRLTCL